MRNFVLFILICVVLLTGCSRQTRNSPAVINQQLSVADVLEQGMAAAETGTVSVEKNSDKDENEIPKVIIRPEETSTPAAPPADAADVAESDDGVDVDLTRLSSTMVYAEVFSMLSTPRNYIGKIVRMRGEYTYFHDPVTDVSIHACLVRDAAACCAQGLEFVLTDDYKFPEDYPNPGDEVTIVGQFNFHSEGENGEYIYFNLIDAVWEK